ncbi:MAG: phosphoenolpyruvate synthase [Hyphomicrobiaceae bacterium]
MTSDRMIVSLSDVRREDTAEVGGKNASLGELISQLRGVGVRVPDGFATTATAYQGYLSANGLNEPMAKTLDRLAPDLSNLADVGTEVRRMILQGEFPDSLSDAIRQSYAALAGGTGHTTAVAVRSSATAEDLPEASFAGQLESFLNVQGNEHLLGAVKRCFASLFTDRAISYRINHGFEHMAVSVSAGVQRMVRSDLAGAGVMFSIDTETGFPRTVLVTAGLGLGETVVQGTVQPDEYHVFKPLLSDPAKRPIIHKVLGSKQQKLICSEDGDQGPTRLLAATQQERDDYVLNDDEVLQLAKWACAIEDHYGVAMDMEWAKDGETGELFIVQARPETVQSLRHTGHLRSYKIGDRGALLASGLAIGEAVASGPVCRLTSPDEISRFIPGAILVTEKTDPDWVPIMKQAAAIVTDHGGRTSHAAIVSRELGLPAIVGTGSTAATLASGQTVTVSCCEGDQGHVYEGVAEVDVQEFDMSAVPATRTKIMLNMANPAAAFRWWQLPCDGVGLARMEFIIGHHIKVHPMALAHFDEVTDAAARAEIEALTSNHASKEDYFGERLATGIARIAAAHYPSPVIVRLSDFKTNEYARLIGGEGFEPKEDNPMIGWRGASRYYSPGYLDGFVLECRALQRVRREIGLDNVVVMVPFCRTLDEADKVLDLMARNGLQRGVDGLKIYMMVEIPANVILADQFAERFDGFSIGSNDLTQLVLGIDRDSDLLSDLFDEEDEAVKTAIRDVLAKARQHGVHTGLCGQAPSDRPAFARFLVECGIDSISVSPDSLLDVKRAVANAEAGPGGRAMQPILAMERQSDD